MEPFSLKKMPDGLEIRMKPSLILVDRAVEEVKTFCRQRDLSLSLFAIIITMREGLTNTIRHGSVLCPDDPIRFSLLLDENTLQMEFEDQGPGFDWQATIKKKRATNSEGGRGLEIIQKYCHTMVYSQRGNHLHITLHI
ncbi:ATP-binding protein [Desulfoluna sp.]|uniref:ATP-binding protein n=1 Tax=Desulfoluna sp. TaxID=2045199 RepID=UPI0026155EBB|nr:ATP-binding protein [Desulfoluna sp.]